MNTATAEFGNARCELQKNLTERIIINYKQMKGKNTYQVSEYCETYILLPYHYIDCSSRIDRRQFVGRSTRAHVVYRNRLPDPSVEFLWLIVHLDFHGIAMRPVRYLAGMFGTPLYGHQSVARLEKKGFYISFQKTAEIFFFKELEAYH